MQVTEFLATTISNPWFLTYNTGMNQNLKTFVESNPRLVTRRQSIRYPDLFVLKYTKRVFFDALWNLDPFLLDCRGLVVDTDYNVVVQPFTKIFNYCENDAGSTWKPDDICEAILKVNGFMASLTLIHGNKVVSTTGSLDSDYVGMAEEYLNSIPVDILDPGRTYMFEICHPLDPHIVPEIAGAHFLAVIDHDTKKIDYAHMDGLLELDLALHGIHINGTRLRLPFSDILELSRVTQHEGWIIVHPSGETVKIKSPHYLFLKFMARVSIPKLISGIYTGTVRQRVDEEFYPIIDRIQEYGVEDFANLPEQQRLVIIRSWIFQEK